MKSTVYVVVYFDCVDHPYIYGVFGNNAGAEHAKRMISEKTEYYCVVYPMDLMAEVDEEKHPFTEKADGAAEKN